MRCNCAMMSPSDTSLEEEEGVDMDGADRDEAEQEGGATKSVCHDLNYASLRLTIAASMAHMTEKLVEEGKGTEKLCKIHVIAEGKMSLSRVAVSLNTSIKKKCEGKSIVRCSNKKNKNRARGSVIEL